MPSPREYAVHNRHFHLTGAFNSRHASRYFELYNPSGTIEIAHTSRYSHKTGKSELCILATRNLAPSSVVTELKGSMANLSNEEDKELKRTNLRNSDIRRDFSVIHSKSMKKNHLFLGPARFVNVSDPLSTLMILFLILIDSMIVTTIVNYSVRADTSPLESSGRLPLAKKSRLIMVMGIVRH